MNLSNYSANWVNLTEIDYADKTYQYRKDITPESVRELAESMKQNSQDIPIVLRRTGHGRLQIVCGFRRYTAALGLGWEKIRAIILPYEDAPDAECRKLSARENIERGQYTNLDKMYMCKKLSDQGVSNVEIGQIIGKSEKQVRRYLKVTEAPADIQEKVKAGEVSIKQAGNEQLGPGAEQAVNNKNCYVKSIKNGFDAVLHFRANRDNPAVLDNHINELKKAFKAATSPRRPATGKGKSASKTPSTLTGEGMDEGSKGGVGAGFSPRNVVADSSASGSEKSSNQPTKPSSPRIVSGDPASKVGPGFSPGNMPGGSMQDLILERQKGMLGQLKQMAQNPITKPIAEQMAKANGCQSVQEFIGKLEKQFSDKGGSSMS